MEKEYPWLLEEKKAIGDYVLNLKKPFLGFCLGCQLLGEVLGGKVVPSDPPEIGLLDININETAKQDPLFNFLPNKIKALQHSRLVRPIENSTPPSQRASIGSASSPKRIGARLLAVL